MKGIRYIALISACTLLLAGLFFIRAQTTAADVKTINLSVRPEKVLFNVENMAPGDWAVRDLAIINDGESDLRYQVTIKYKSGKKLFKEMNLEINQGSNSLYGGKLADFKKLEPRQLQQNSEETLTFHAEFPPELGNDFQGAETKFDIVISAEEIKGGGGGTPGTNPEPPKTGAPTDPSTPTNPTNPTTPTDPTDPKPGEPDPDNPDTETPSVPDDGDPDGEGQPGQDPDEPEKDGDDQGDDKTALPGNNSGDGGNSGVGTGGSATAAAGTGQPLPNTATNMFNYMLGGGVLILLGLASLILAMRRKAGGKTL